MSLVLYIIFNLSHENEEKIEAEARKNELRIAQIRIEQGEQQYRNMMEKIERTRIIRHDLNHHFRVIYNYCNEEKYDKIQEYMNKLKIWNLTEQVKVYCKNHIANIILGYYAKLAEEADIKFQCQTDLQPECLIDDVDLGVILGNSLENALEACRKMDGNRYIDIKMRQENNRLVICFRNSFNGFIQKEKDSFISLKDGEGHGFGIKSIQRAVEKYNGYCSFSSDDKDFSLQIVIEAM